MSRTKRKSRGKTINPTFFVFCEGETEYAYINYLRSKYRLPIEIDCKIAGNRITEKYINNYKRDKDIHPKDKTYLAYDLDVAGMLNKLQRIKNTTLLSSNPCFELWLLLHYQEQKTELTSIECIKRLKDHHTSYAKGLLDNAIKSTLDAKLEKAVNRALKLGEFKNPSSQLFVLIQDLTNVKSQNNNP